MEDWQKETIRALETRKKEKASAVAEARRGLRKAERKLRAAENEVEKIDRAIAAIRGEGRPAPTREEVTACVERLIAVNGEVAQQDLRPLVVDELRASRDLTGVLRQFSKWVDELPGVTLEGGVYRPAARPGRRTA